MTAPSPEPALSIEQRVLDAARALGFAAAGIAASHRSEQAAERLARWLEAGHHGEMHYLAGGLDRSEPSGLLASVQSVLVVALPYGRAPERPNADVLWPRRSAAGAAAAGALRGKVASYAQGEDYHRVLKAKLEELGRAIESIAGRPVARRACVDSAPLLERDFAVRAGLGFHAKSTLTILPGAGSYVLLGELLLDLALTPTPAAPLSGCGSCTRCLTACPTSAFVGPYVLDARRCISYLTIELKGAIPRELRSSIGSHVFGCDICQDVCPWNHSRHAPSRAPELGSHAALESPALEELLFLSSSGYRKLVQGTALSRVSRARLARNAAVALGNSGDTRAEAPLSRALAEHSYELVRQHAAWALGALAAQGVKLDAGRAALETAETADPSSDVRAEARAALAQLRPIAP